jgi:hypothetical protein
LVQVSSNIPNSNNLQENEKNNKIVKKQTSAKVLNSKKYSTKIHEQA